MDATNFVIQYFWWFCRHAPHARRAGNNANGQLGGLVADRVFGLVVGYGHKPERSFYMLLALVFVGWFLADRSWEEGDFAPTAGPVLMSESWQYQHMSITYQNSLLYLFLQSISFFPLFVVLLFLLFRVSNIFLIVLFC